MQSRAVVRSGGIMSAIAYSHQLSHAAPKNIGESWLSAKYLHLDFMASGHNNPRAVLPSGFAEDVCHVAAQETARRSSQQDCQPVLVRQTSARRLCWLCSGVSGKTRRTPSGGPGQTWFSLKKIDVDEYARSHPANPGP